MSCKCQSCDKMYDEDLIVPDDVWEIIKPNGKPKGAGLLCPSCIWFRLDNLTEALGSSDGMTVEEVKEELREEGWDVDGFVNRMKEKIEEFRAEWDKT